MMNGDYKSSPGEKSGNDLTNGGLEEELSQESNVRRSTSRRAVHQSRRICGRVGDDCCFTAAHSYVLSVCLSFVRYIR
jgi:hypothetical protein